MPKRILNPDWRKERKLRIQRLKARERVRYNYYFNPYKVKGVQYSPQTKLKWYARITRNYVTVYMPFATRREARMKFLEWSARLRTGEWDIHDVYDDAHANRKVRVFDPPTKNTPKVRGVSYNPISRKWLASHTIHGHMRAKNFDTQAEAIAQRKEWENTYGKPQSTLYGDPSARRR